MKTIAPYFKTLSVVAVILGLVTLLSLRVEPPYRECVYPECAMCGLLGPEVDQLIDDARHSTLSREENLRLFLRTFDDPEAAEECNPCAEAILDAAASE